MRCVVSLDSALDILRPDKYSDENLRTPAFCLIHYSLELDDGDMTLPFSTGLDSAIIATAAASVTPALAYLLHCNTRQGSQRKTKKVTGSSATLASSSNFCSSLQAFLSC